MCVVSLMNSYLINTLENTVLRHGVLSNHCFTVNWTHSCLCLRVNRTRPESTVTWRIGLSTLLDVSNIVTSHDSEWDTEWCCDQHPRAGSVVASRVRLFKWDTTEWSEVKHFPKPYLNPPQCLSKLLLIHNTHGSQNYNNGCSSTTEEHNATCSISVEK